MANYDDGFNRLERQIDGLRVDIDRKFDAADRKVDSARAEVPLLKWMIGTTLALVLAVFIKMFVR